MTWLERLSTPCPLTHVGERLFDRDETGRLIFRCSACCQVIGPVLPDAEPVVEKR